LHCSSKDREKTRAQKKEGNVRMEECEPVAKQRVRRSGSVYFCLPAPWVQTASYSWSESHTPSLPPLLSLSLWSGMIKWIRSTARDGKSFISAADDHRAEEGSHLTQQIMRAIGQWAVPAAGVFLSELVEEIHSMDENTVWLKCWCGQRAVMIQTQTPSDTEKVKIQNQALIIKIKTKTPLKCFTLHVMNLKYMKMSLFEISYKKMFYFFTIF